METNIPGLRANSRERSNSGSDEDDLYDSETLMIVSTFKANVYAGLLTQKQKFSIIDTNEKSELLFLDQFTNSHENFTICSSEGSQWIFNITSEILSNSSFVFKSGLCRIDIKEEGSM